jgi:hypothetical protein
MDLTIYKLLLWAVPLLLAVLGFIGALAVNSLVKLADSVNQIKVTIEGMAKSHEGLEKRVQILEDHKV